MNCNNKIIKLIKKYIVWIKYLQCSRYGLTLRLEVRQKLEFDLLMHRADIEELFFLEEYLRTSVNKTFFDLGANIGFYSMYIAKNVQNVEVFAFEPDDYNINKFQHNITLNALKNITIFPYAVAEANQNMQLRIKPFGRGSNSLLLPQKFHEKNDTFQQIEAKRLIDVVNETGVSSIGAMKIDIEGYEYLVIKDFFVEENRALFPKVLIIEEWGHIIKRNGNSSIQLLLNLGYRLVNHKGDNFFLHYND